MARRRRKQQRCVVCGQWIEPRGLDACDPVLHQDRCEECRRLMDGEPEERVFRFVREQAWFED